jgi:hypothetical protein
LKSTQSILLCQIQVIARSHSFFFSSIASQLKEDAIAKEFLYNSAGYWLLFLRLHLKGEHFEILDFRLCPPL